MINKHEIIMLILDSEGIYHETQLSVLITAPQGMALCTQRFSKRGNDLRQVPATVPAGRPGGRLRRETGVTVELSRPT